MNGHVVPSLDYTSFNKVPPVALDSTTSHVLPPRPAEQVIHTVTTLNRPDTNFAIQLPRCGITRSRHRFRANAAPFIPQSVMQTILESEEPRTHPTPMRMLQTHRSHCPTLHKRAQLPFSGLPMQPCPHQQTLTPLSAPPIVERHCSQLLRHRCAAHNVSPNSLNVWNPHTFVPLTELRNQVQQPTPPFRSQISH